MSRKERKWTHEIRRQVFEWLRAEIGRIDPQQPSLFSSTQEKKRALKKIVEKLTELYGQGYTVSNVSMQVDWALTPQNRVKKTFIRQYFFCKAAALEAGLISERNFPDSIKIWE